MGNFTRKHLCWSHFLIQLQAKRPVTLLKKTPTQVFSCEIFENFKNTCFEEHLPPSAPDHFRKISLLFVLGKPFLDGKRRSQATYNFYWKCKPHEVDFCSIRRKVRRKTPVSESFHKVAGLRPVTLLKKKLWHKCFSANFTKFLRTPPVAASTFWDFPCQ